MKLALPSLAFKATTPPNEVASKINRSNDTKASRIGVARQQEPGDQDAYLMIATGEKGSHARYRDVNNHHSHSLVSIHAPRPPGRHRCTRRTPTTRVAC